MDDRLTPDAARAALARGSGASVALFRHGSLEVKYYAPRGEDRQTPHPRDEIYVIAAGHAAFVHGLARRPCEAGEVLFAAAGEAHRFEEMSEDFGTWVFFYGPPGGEAAGGSGAGEAAGDSDVGEAAGDSDVGKAAGDSNAGGAPS